MNLTHAPKMPRLVQKSPKNSKIRSTLRVRIEGNIENGNCYCIQIDYDDNNEEVEEKEEEEEEEEKGGEEEEEEKDEEWRKRRYKVLEGSYSAWL